MSNEERENQRLQHAPLTSLAKGRRRSLRAPTRNLLRKFRLPRKGEAGQASPAVHCAGQRAAARKRKAWSTQRAVHLPLAGRSKPRSGFGWGKGLPLRALHRNEARGCSTRFGRAFHNFASAELSSALMRNGFAPHARPPSGFSVKVFCRPRIWPDLPAAFGRWWSQVAQRVVGSPPSGFSVRVFWGPQIWPSLCADFGRWGMGSRE